MLYLSIKLIHILFAVAGVGTNLTYMVWFTLAARGRAHLEFVLTGVQTLDDWIANPAYVGLGLSGPALVWAGGLAWSLLWVWLAMALLVLTCLLGFGVYTPLLRRQIAALRSFGPDSALYLGLSRRGAALGLFFTFVNLLIFILMVFKPQ